MMDHAAEQVNHIRRVSEVLTPSSVVRRKLFVMMLCTLTVVWF
jgi:hypothetical protein